jgi:nitrite reductase/ring-hydroxylating ferredoxin subunit/uncharacterized membrane protein
VLHGLVDWIGRQQTLDGAGAVVDSALRPLISPRSLRLALSGAWLGHRLHPVLTDVPIGAFASAGLLDAVGGAGAEQAADRLVAVGVATTLPTALAGWSDWVDVRGEARRIGLVHAAANVTALGLQAASLRARRQGHRGLGKTLSLLGLTVLSAGGYLGGHLSFVLGVGVARTAFDEGPDDWTSVGPEHEFQEGQPRSVHAGGRDVMVVRQGGRILALANRCSHAGGSLAEGTLQDGSVRCPRHGSVFRLEDGAVVAGPAATPQPRLDVRVRGGVIEVRQP